MNSWLSGSLLGCLCDPYVTWVETAREASKFSKEQAEKLVSDLEQCEPGSTYTAERHEKGESNQLPYGLDNLVVRKS